MTHTPQAGSMKQNTLKELQNETQCMSLYCSMCDMFSDGAVNLSVNAAFSLFL